MAMHSTWAMPEEGFDPDDNSAVLAYYGNENAGERAALDPKGQRAPPLEERIQASFRDFERLIKRPPTEEEKKRMVDTQIKCSGWLEGLKVDLAGKTEVPIHYFNRLVQEQEDMILFVARDRVQFDAEWMQKVMQHEDKIKELTEELEKSKADSGAASDTVAVDNLTKEKSELEAQLEKSKGENKTLQHNLDLLQATATPALGDQLIAIAEEESKIKELEAKNQTLQDELDKLKEATKGCGEVKTENAKLKDNIQTRETELKDREEKIQTLQDERDKLASASPTGVETAQLEVKDKEINSLKSQVESAKSELVEKTRELYEANAQKELNLNQKSQAQSEADAAREQEARKQLEDKDSEISKLRKKLDSCEAHKKTADEEIDKLKKELQDLKDKENKELRKLQKKLEDCEDHGKHLEGIIYSLKNQLRDLQKIIGHRDTRIVELMQEQEDNLVQRDLERVKAREQYSANQEAVIETEEALMEARNELEERVEADWKVESERDDLQNRVEDLEIQLKRLKRTNEVQAAQLSRSRQPFKPSPPGSRDSSPPPKPPGDLSGLTRDQVRQRQREIFQEIRETIIRTDKKVRAFKTLAKRHARDCHGENVVLSDTESDMGSP